MQLGSEGRGSPGCQSSALGLARQADFPRPLPVAFALRPSPLRQWLRDEVGGRQVACYSTGEQGHAAAGQLLRRGRWRRFLQLPLLAGLFSAPLGCGGVCALEGGAVSRPSHAHTGSGYTVLSRGVGATTSCRSVGLHVSGCQDRQKRELERLVLHSLLAVRCLRVEAQRPARVGPRGWPLPPLAACLLSRGLVDRAA